jgi:hypothetical protein
VTPQPAPRGSAVAAAAAAVLVAALGARSAGARERSEIDQKVTRPPGVEVSVEVVRATPAVSGDPAHAETRPGPRPAGGRPETAKKPSLAATPATSTAQPCLRRRVGGSWGTTLSVCASGPGPAPRRRQPGRLPVRQVARVLLDRARSLAPDPRVEIAPAATGVTGLTTYFWTESAAPVRASATVRSITVTARARPSRYVGVRGWRRRRHL